jgi:tRNA-dihydrouridine synthase
LLRDLNAIDSILGALRDALEIPFTVKTRIGFENPSVFPELLRLLSKHCVDLVTVHARTVKQMYQGEPDYSFITEAARVVPCSVMANGNISSAEQAEQVVKDTGAHGLMLGRGAVRNPWLFQQIRDHFQGKRSLVPIGREVLEYIRRLYDAACSQDMPEFSQVQRMKKYMNYLGLGVDGAGEFLHLIRRAGTRAEFLAICGRFLDHDRPMSLDPAAVSADSPLPAALPA